MSNTDLSYKKTIGAKQSLRLFLHISAIAPQFSPKTK